MELIKLNVYGLNLFQDGIELNFIAQQKVTENNREGLTHLIGSVYRQNAIGIIGINASGKTTVLKVLSLVLDLYVNHGTLNDDKYQFLYNEKSFEIEAYFYLANKQIMKIHSKIVRNHRNEFVFEEEKIWIKSVGNLKKYLFEFDDKHLKVTRSLENSPYLTDYMSIMIAQLKNHEIPSIIDLIKETNTNVMRVAGHIPLQMVGFLDNSIEYLHEEKDANQNIMIRLKFKGQKEEIYLNNRQHLEAYLSSGTIKGLNVLAAVEKVFKTGGFLIIDEIENHFNKEIVRTIINFFKNERTNSKGATLVFTTHYSELLDDFERNDSIYIAFKEETLRLKNLHKLLERNDYKKSDVYQSSYLGATAPSYNAYMDLKKYFQQVN